MLIYKYEEICVFFEGINIFIKINDKYYFFIDDENEGRVKGYCGYFVNVGEYVFFCLGLKFYFINFCINKLWKNICYIINSFKW